VRSSWVIDATNWLRWVAAWISCAVRCSSTASRARSTRSVAAEYAAGTHTMIAQ
jgi:hypothetical protein